ncbi:hypothetical protein FRC12_003448 [Ceratobasidium sp. 428]|nr:hypothetical protein FRC12_003448 [Ceratobasidium sp. 428]
MLALELEREKRRMRTCYPLFGKPKEPAQKAAELLLHCANVDLAKDRASQLPAPIMETIETTVGMVNNVLQRATGAVIYTIAVWDDGDSGTQVYEWIPPRIGDKLVANREWVEKFLFATHTTLGPAFSRDFPTTYPAIYGLKQHDWRPRLPPRHPMLQQEVDWIDEYMQALSCKLSTLYGSFVLLLTTTEAWQGWTDFSWEYLQEDYISQTNRLVSLFRLPDQLKQLTHPSTWDAEQVYLLGDFIRRGQRVIDRQDVGQYHWVFQFREGNEDLLRLAAPSNTTLEYNYDSTIYYGAMLQYQFSDDTYHGQLSQPPLIPPSMMPAFEKHALIVIPELRKVWKAIETYQQTKPPEREPHDSDPEIFKMFDFSEGNLEHFFKLPKFPDSYMMWLDPKFKEWHPSYFVFWATKTKALYDFKTQLLCGGYGGIMRVFFVVLLMYKTRAWAAALVRSGQPVPHDLRSFGDDENEQIRLLIQFILTATSTSSRDARPPNRPILRPGSRRSCWPAEQIRCSNNLNLIYHNPIDRNMTVYPLPNAPSVSPVADANAGVKNEVIELPDSDELSEAPEKAQDGVVGTTEDMTTALAAGQTVETPEATLRSGSVAQETEPQSQIVFAMPQVHPAPGSGRRSSSEPPAPPSQRETPHKTAEMVRVDNQTTLFQDLQDTSTPWPRGRVQEVKSRSDHRQSVTIESETRGDEVKTRTGAAEPSTSFISAGFSNSKTPTRFGRQTTESGTGNPTPQRAVSAAARRPGIVPTPNYFSVAAQQSASSRSRDATRQVQRWVPHLPSRLSVRPELLDLWCLNNASRRYGHRTSDRYHLTPAVYRKRVDQAQVVVDESALSLILVVYTLHNQSIDIKQRADDGASFSDFAV